MRVKIVRLGEVAEVNPRRPDIDFVEDETVTFIPMEAIDDVTGHILRPVERRFGQVKSGYTVFAEDDVIFAKITPCMQNGKHAIARNLIKGVGFGSTEFHSIRAGKDILPEWIHFYLRKKETLDAAISTFTGTVGQQRVPKTFLENLKLPLPPIDKQRRIASQLKAQLATVEEARSAVRAQLTDIEQLRTHSLNQLFASFETSRPIGAAAKVQSGFAFKSQDFTTSGVRLLRNTNVSPGMITWGEVACLPEDKANGFDNYIVRDGDVIISLDRPIISSGIKVARVTASDLPCLLVQRVGRFLLDESQLDAAYLYAFLQTDRFKEAISGHEQSLGVPHISPGQVEAVEIPLPPLVEQQRIGRIAKEVLATTEEAKLAAVTMLADISLLPSRLLATALDFEK